MAFTTPIAFLIFNRPDVTRQVFEVIRFLKPERLLVVGDGHRQHKTGESELVEQTRRIVNDVDWKCDLQTNFSTENLGCKERVSSGLKWIFNEVEEAIILEDDCLPDSSFFYFCQDMLERYRRDETVFSISGNNFQAGQSRCSNGYYFSKYFHCWGWASWRRVCDRIDWELVNWERFVENGGLVELADDRRETEHWRKILGQQAQGQIDSWAYTWLANCWMGKQLNILPDSNLISNIGFGKTATHTQQSNSKLAGLPTSSLKGWNSAVAVERNRQADLFTFQNVYRRPNRFIRLRDKILKRLLGLNQRQAA